MFKKLNKKGFTLAELLIVVAIIGVLVAISIPIFTGQLEKAKEATDAANIRSAYAAVSADLLLDSETDDTANEIKYKADATNGDTYTAWVPATQAKAKWQSDGDAETLKIGGQDVKATVKSADNKGYTVVGNVKTGVVTIKDNQAKPTT